jgi:hypothetical protein
LQRVRGQRARPAGRPEAYGRGRPHRRWVAVGGAEPLTASTAVDRAGLVGRGRSSSLIALAAGLPDAAGRRAAVPEDSSEHAIRGDIGSDARLQASSQSWRRRVLDHRPHPLAEERPMQGCFAPCVAPSSATMGRACSASAATRTRSSRAGQHGRDITVQCRPTGDPLLEIAGLPSRTQGRRPSCGRPRRPQPTADALER